MSDIGTDQKEKGNGGTIHDEKRERKTNDKFGLIFHWGRYSVYQFDIVNPNRKIGNGSEWFEYRCDSKIIKKDNTATQEFWKQHFADKTPADIDEMFNTTEKKGGPKEWIALAQQVGATYVILTAKHHDGFCLWPTKTTSHCVTHDWVGEFVNIAREKGLKVGLYYSWYEFENPSCTKNYLQSIVAKQVRELVQQYNPDIWWFDGQWVCRSKYAKQFISDTVSGLKRINPKVEINDRISDVKQATFRVFEDRHIPDEIPNQPWEHINTIGLSWGRNAQQKPHHYKTAKQLMELCRLVRAKNGRFLLNLGPNADGTLDSEEMKRLIEFGTLMKLK